MATKVVMPKLGLTMTEGVLSRWLVADGAEVKKGQPIFEVETDKVVNEAQADADGILRIVAEASSVVPVMGLVGYILEPGEEMPATPTPPSEAEARAAAVSPATERPAQLPQPGRRGLASPAARRRARELKVDINQVQGSGQGGRITISDVEAFAESQTKEVKPAATGVRASPLARRMAREAGIDLTAIQGSGTGGRITREDVEKVLSEGRPPATEEVASEGEYIPLSGVRAIIAERMMASSQGTAAVTITSSVDATELVDMRDQLNEGLADQLGFRIAYNDILIKVVARALKEFPYMNAHQERGGVRQLSNVHIGLAVDTERGLMVIVVRDADQKSILQISREAHDKAERAVTGEVLPDELTGSTFTITNLGRFGVEAFTPIINPPEVAILGVGRIEPAPMVYKGETSLRQRMVLSLTFDHRVVDGAPAARFLERIRYLIERPYLVMVEDWPSNFGS
ncbi:MAG: dihydrolipoamide acetyltransferase [Anaerolineae bacterium]